MKNKFPITLGTSTSNKHTLYQQISSDVEYMNNCYDILPIEFESDLCSDLKLLIDNNISEHFKIVFYNPLNEEEIFLEKSYLISSNNANNSKTSQSSQIKKYDIPSPYEFDIFIYFSESFLALNEDRRNSILKKFNFKWFKIFGALSSELAESSKEIIPKEANETKEQLLPTPITTPEARATEVDITATVTTTVTLNNPLTIASYANTDSRKLIDEFVSVSLKQGLTPILWTHSEGLKIIGNDKSNSSSSSSSAGKYIFDDELYTRVFLSPFELLKQIKGSRKQNISYILEDFHYYLTRDNLSASEFSELISLIKSIQSDLKANNSFVTILAPNLDLPPEIAPIFDRVKNNTGQKKFYYLEKYGTDLTKLVFEGKIRPIVGRELEITECLKIISKMETNNPLLIGQSGVGKTAIVEGLAATLINNKTSSLWAHKKLISLNLNLMISGTK
ncbi:MAG: hypothetical protein HQK51_12125, partial [Oligoflexia bacterium]|nr:hypothetical protein [Oligoflexia bacterium]